MSGSPFKQGLFVVVVIIAVMALLHRLRPAPAALPAVFDESLTFDDARTRAADLDRPVFIYAGADWCGPCQLLRQELADDAVVRALEQHTVPVHLDFTVTSAPEVRALARRLNISAFPTLILCEDDRELDRLVGAYDAQTIAHWILEH
jgi:thiol:disulfide interchange protein